MKSRKSIRIIFMVAAYFTVASVCFAEGKTSPASDFVYESKGKEITITGYTGTSSIVVIPELIEGLPVTTIESGAFKNNMTMTRIEVPSSVNRIHSDAFYNCSALKEAYLDLAPIAYIKGKINIGHDDGYVFIIVLH